MAQPSRADEGALTPKAIKTRERILDAAEALFTTRGFDAATTREIARRSKTNVATTYSYFSSKEDLYTAVIHRAIAPLLALMDRFAVERDEPGAADRAIHDVLAHLAEHEATTRLVYREVVAEGPLAAELTETLFAPLLGRVCSELRSSGRTDRDMEPFVSALFIHLSFSHVALAPLLSRVFDRDMLSPKSLARQVEVIGAAANLTQVGSSKAGRANRAPRGAARARRA